MCVCVCVCSQCARSFSQSRNILERLCGFAPSYYCRVSQSAGLTNKSMYSAPSLPPSLPRVSYTRYVSHVLYRRFIPRDPVEPLNRLTGCTSLDTSLTPDIPFFVLHIERHVTFHSVLCRWKADHVGYRDSKILHERERKGGGGRVREHAEKGINGGGATPERN